MREDSLSFLRNMLEVPSPSGYEQPAQKVVRDWAGKFADDVTTDLHGNVIASMNPKGSPRIMFAGHCDQIGFMVQHIDKEGYLFINPIGGHDMMVLLGQNVTVWGSDGPIHGVMARKPIHLLKGDSNRAPKFQDLWVDIGVKTKKEAEQYVELGDPVTFRLGMVETLNGRATAVGFDDKAGAWVVMEALRLLKGKKFTAAVYSVSTVQEEVGLRGAKTSAFGIDPQIGIAVDVTFATDHPGMDPKISGEVNLDKGAVIARGPNINPVVFDILKRTAKRKRIPFQINGVSRPTGTDANAIQVSGPGVATGLVSVPNRYMHSPVEMVSLKDMQNCAKLLSEFVLSVKKTTDFTP
ncbi:MAG: M42 family metallopeptidase [Planctomycetota bacterium]|jgi:endoglucanase|nr:M42 family metallopeptidase [Planctomycetota bacterium]